MPGTSDATPSVLVTERSAVGTSASTSVAALLAGFGSVTPTGTLTDTELVIEPVADVDTVPLMVKVAAPPTARSTVVLMLPDPEAAHVPPAAEQVQVAPRMDAGMTSTTAAPTTLDGPAFDTTIVYDTGVPGTSDTTPSVLVTDRSALGDNVSTSVAELFERSGSVTPPGTVAVAVLASVPVASAATKPVTVYVTDPPAGTLTTSAMSPVPEGEHVAPPATAQDHDTFDSADGMPSATEAPTTFDGPAFVTTIVYDTAVPGTSVAEPSVLVTERSATATMEVVSVAVLLAGVGSTPGAGMATVAVFDRVPVKEAAIVALTVNVATPPESRSTLVEMLPAPPSAPHVEPAVAAHVHVAALSWAGSTSATGAPVTLDGPALVTAIV